MKLVTGFRSYAKTQSNYKQLQQFFLLHRDSSRRGKLAESCGHFDLDYKAIAKIIVALMDIPQPWILSTDRTARSFGQIRFNILILSIVHVGVAYPIVWEMLEKKGNFFLDRKTQGKQHLTFGDRQTSRF